MGWSASHTKKITRLALGLPLNLAGDGKLGGHACGLTIAFPASMLARAVEPMPTVVWLIKERRLMKVGCMAKGELKSCRSFVHVE